MGMGERRQAPHLIFDALLSLSGAVDRAVLRWVPEQGGATGLARGSPAETTPGGAASADAS